MGATAAWVYQKWDVYVCGSVFRVFGGDLDPLFRETIKNSYLIDLGQRFDYALIKDAEPEVLSKNMFLKNVFQDNFFLKQYFWSKSFLASK